MGLRFMGLSDRCCGGLAARALAPRVRDLRRFRSRMRGTTYLDVPARGLVAPSCGPVWSSGTGPCNRSYKNFSPVTRVPAKHFPLVALFTGPRFLPAEMGKNHR